MRVSISYMVWRGDMIAPFTEPDSRAMTEAGLEGPWKASRPHGTFKVIQVRRRQADGPWQILMDLYNLPLPPPKAED